LWLISLGEFLGDDLTEVEHHQMIDELHHEVHVVLDEEHTHGRFEFDDEVREGLLSS
jgi:hypothetical protein